MQLSNELRWFFSDQSDQSDQFSNWFLKQFTLAAGGGQLRTDCYLIEQGQTELGIKIREGKPGVEIKGLVNRSNQFIQCGSLDGRVETWCKWTSSKISIDRLETILIPKRRWLRKFDFTAGVPEEIALDDYEKPLDKNYLLPVVGCNVELTEITLSSKKNAWTFGLESFGPENHSINALKETARFLNVPPFVASSNVKYQSYPEWINDVLTKGRAPKEVG